MEDQKRKIDAVREWLVAAITPLLDEPSKLSVRPSIDTKGVLFTVKPHDIDAGSLIGKGGTTVRSIRTLLASVGKRNDMRASMVLDVPEYKTQ
jgi:predicted RNA-binding protein YlqC (UPF0109 family)